MFHGYVSLQEGTLPETNIAFENWWLGDDPFHLGQTAHFQERIGCQFQGGWVSMAFSGMPEVGRMCAGHRNDMRFESTPIV